MDQKNNINDINLQLLEEIRALKKQLFLRENPISKDWIPRESVMEFLGYENTQMAYVAKKFNLVVSQVGKKKFFHRDSIISMLELNRL